MTVIAPQQEDSGNARAKQAARDAASTNGHQELNPVIEGCEFVYEVRPTPFVK